MAGNGVARPTTEQAKLRRRDFEKDVKRAKREGEEHKKVVRRGVNMSRSMYGRIGRRGSEPEASRNETRLSLDASMLYLEGKSRIKGNLTIIDDKIGRICKTLEDLPFEGSPG